MGRRGTTVPDPPRPARLSFEDDLTIVAPLNLPLMDRYRLLRFTEPVTGAGQTILQATKHRISRESLARARAEGVKAQSLQKYLDEASGGKTPQRISAGLERWDQHSGTVRVSRGAVLRVEDASTLSLLRADPVLRPLLGEMLSAQAILVSEANLPRVMAASARVGLWRQGGLIEMTEDLAARIARLERLRRLGLRRGARDLPRPVAPERGRHIAELPGEPVMTPFGEAWARTARFSLADDAELAQFRDARPDMLAAVGQDPGLAALDPARAAYIDTETTGLSLGAGTYTFLIGIGQYEAPSPDAPAGAFAVRQFFMRSPLEEAAQLHLVEETAGADERFRQLQRSRRSTCRS